MAHCRRTPDAAATLKIADRIGIDWSKVLFKPADLRRGIKVELEHSRCISAETNVTHGNLELTARIAWAHLKEDFRYYDLNIGLPAWESKLEKTRAAAVKARKAQISQTRKATAARSLKR